MSSRAGPDSIDPVEEAAKLIAGSSYAVALVGAGLSVESGVPTFRGPGGLWTRIGQPSMNGYKQFLADPAAWWEHQIDRDADPARTEFRDAIDRARPNSGHYALAELEVAGLLKMTISQNVDDLHFKAGSSRVAEIHGNRTKLRCVQCESRWPRDEFEIDLYPPACPECGGLVKGDTVMFGEPIPPGVMEMCFTEVGRCDCMIVAGTSATVYPAAGFPIQVYDSGGTIIEANPNETPISDIADVVLRGPTGEALPAVVHRIKEMLA